MPLLQRIAIFLGLWLLAGGACAIFTEGTVEAGESEALARLQLAILAPSVAAAGIAFTLVHDHYDTWQQRDHYQWVIWWIVMACLVVHSAIALTRRDRRQFLALVGIQVVILVGSVPCVLFMFRYFATHGHG